MFVGENGARTLTVAKGEELQDLYAESFLKLNLLGQHSAAEE
jgi:hypothetical protein